MSKQRKKPTLVRVNQQDEQGADLGQQTVPLASMKDSPRRREKLPPELEKRALAVWKRIKDCSPNLTEFLDGFLRDMHPEREIMIFERIADVVDQLWVTDASKPLTRQQLIRVVTGVSAGIVDIPAHVRGVTDELVETIRQKLGMPA